MHWAAPRTIGRMISVQKDRMRSSFSVDKECSSPNKNQEEEEEEEEEEENVSDPGSDSDGVDPEDVEYEPKSYASLGFRVPTPPPGVLKTEDEKAREEDEAKRQIFQVTIKSKDYKAQINILLKNIHPCHSINQFVFDLQECCRNRAQASAK